MEVDTGASASIISEHTYRTTWPAKQRPPLRQSDTRLHTYSGELIQVLGTITVPVCYRQQVRQLSLLVVPTEGPSLFGQDWLQAITLDWKQLNRIHYVRHRALQDVLDQYKDLFQPGMGTLRDTTVKIHIQDADHGSSELAPCRMPYATKLFRNLIAYATPMLSSRYNSRSGQHPSSRCSRTMAPLDSAEIIVRPSTKSPCQTSILYHE